MFSLIANFHIPRVCNFDFMAITNLRIYKNFLDVLVKRCDDGHLETSVYRKKTNTDLYINWKSHAPVQWKSTNLKGLVKRAILIPSAKEAMEQELEHLKQVFCKINDYPRKFVENIVIDAQNNLI